MRNYEAIANLYQFLIFAFGLGLMPHLNVLSMLRWLHE